MYFSHMDIFVLAEMNVQLASDSSFWTEVVQRLVASLESSDVYLFRDIKFVCVMIRGVHEKLIQKCSMGHGSANSPA